MIIASETKIGIVHWNIEIRLNEARNYWTNAIFDKYTERQLIGLSKFYSNRFNLVGSEICSRIINYSIKISLKIFSNSLFTSQTIISPYTVQLSR